MKMKWKKNLNLRNMKTKTFQQVTEQVCRIVDLISDGDMSAARHADKALEIYRHYSKNFAEHEPAVNGKRTGNVPLTISQYAK